MRRNAVASSDAPGALIPPRQRSGESPPVWRPEAAIASPNARTDRRIAAHRIGWRRSEPHAEPAIRVGGGDAPKPPEIGDLSSRSTERCPRTVSQNAMRPVGAGGPGCRSARWPALGHSSESLVGTYVGAARRRRHRGQRADRLRPRAESGMDRRHRLCEACVSSRAPPANHGKPGEWGQPRSRSEKAVTWASSLVTACQVGRPRQDSNLRTRLRRPMLYPLSYEGREGQGSALAPGGRTSARASRPTTGADWRPWRMRRGSSTPCARAGTSS